MVYNFKNSINCYELEKCANEIKAGKLVIFPTETVYGLGADATNSEACIDIYKAKNRANDNPLIVHVTDKTMIKKITKDITPLEEKLIDTFMPGPFTLILKKKDIISDVASCNLDTIGIRMPDNEIAHLFIKACNTPIAAPSANRSGRPSGTNVEDIIDEFPNIDFIDGGDTSIGLESTVVKVIDGYVTILRPGYVTYEDLLKVTPKVKLSDNLFKKATGVVESPGMKYKHYAPKSKCILVYNDDKDKLIDIVNRNIKDNTIVIGYSNLKDKFNVKYYEYGDTLEEISHNIFSLLRRADNDNPDLIIVMGCKKEGLGLAIMNRLIRSAGYNIVKE